MLSDIEYEHFMTVHLLLSGSELYHPHTGFILHFREKRFVLFFLSASHFLGGPSIGIFFLFVHCYYGEEN